MIHFQVHWRSCSFIYW